METHIVMESELSQHTVKELSFPEYQGLDIEMEEATISEDKSKPIKHRVEEYSLSGSEGSPSPNLRAVRQRKESDRSIGSA
jgi:hypothetical protein